MAYLHEQGVVHRDAWEPVKDPSMLAGKVRERVQA